MAYVFVESERLKEMCNKMLALIDLRREEGRVKLLADTVAKLNRKRWWRRKTPNWTPETLLAEAVKHSHDILFNKYAQLNYDYLLINSWYGKYADICYGLLGCCNQNTRVLVSDEDLEDIT